MKTKINKLARLEGEKISENNGALLQGVVVSDKMTKTVVVSVSRFVKHPKYGKYYKIDKKYKAHSEENKYKTGDRVEISETKPMSKDKHYKVVGLVGAVK